MLSVEVTSTTVIVKRGTVEIAKWTFQNGTLNPSDISRFVEVSLAFESKPCASAR